MRVIAGQARGVPLIAPPGHGTRPTSDRTKESLFAVLGDLGCEGRVLDLFAGSGALGIEALSRGASFCDFVEAAAPACRAIAANLAKTKLADLGRIHRQPVARFLAAPRRGGAPPDEEPYDLILMDPPYAMEGLDAVLCEVAKSSLVGPRTALMIEHGRQRSLPPRLGTLELAKTRAHGDSAFSLYWPIAAAAVYLPIVAPETPGNREQPGGRIAVFPGTFDPPTNGHLETARKAARLFDHVVMAVYATTNKQTIFSADERLALVQAAVEEWGLSNVRVRSFGSRLLVEVAREEGAIALVKGLRAVSDFDSEFQMAHMNEQLAPEIVTVAVLSSAETSFLSSTLVREVARLGEDVGKWVPAAAAAGLRAHFGLPSAAPLRAGIAGTALEAEGAADRIGGFVVQDEGVR